jgi:hypothetical protein
MVIVSLEDRFELAPVPAIESGDHFDDRGFRVAVSCRQFSARVDELRSVAQEWREFVLSLRNLERTRQGEARVSSMDPSQFSIRVFSWSSGGHLALEGHIGRYHSCEYGLALQQLRFGMDVPGDQFGALVAVAESIARPG